MKTLSYTMAIFCMMCSAAMSLNACCDCDKPETNLVPAISFASKAGEKCGCNKPRPGRPGRKSFLFSSTEEDKSGEKCGCGKPRTDK